MSHLRNKVVTTSDLFMMGFNPASERKMSITTNGQTVEITLERGQNMVDVMSSINTAWANKVNEVQATKEGNFNV